MLLVPLNKQLIARTQKPEKMVSIRKAELKNIINFLKFDQLKAFTEALVCFMEAETNAQAMAPHLSEELGNI